MGDLFKRGKFVPYEWNSISGVVGNGDIACLKFIFIIQSNLYIWGIQAYFHLKMENFALISVMNQMGDKKFIL